MNKNLAAASFGSSNDDDEEGGVPTPLVPPSMNPAPSLLNSDFHTDEDSYLQPRPPSAASDGVSASSTANPPDHSGLFGENFYVPHGLENTNPPQGAPTPAISGEPESIVGWNHQGINGDDGTDVKASPPSPSTSTNVPFAVQQHETALRKLQDFTAGGEPYLLMNGDPMKMTPTVRGPRPLPVSGADEHHEAMNWLNQRAQLQDDVNRLKPAADYDREMASTANGNVDPNSAANTRIIPELPRGGDFQSVSAPKTEAQKEAERVAAQIKAVPEAGSAAKDHPQTNLQQYQNSLNTLWSVLGDYKQSDKAAYPNFDAYAAAKYGERWKSLEDDMKKQLDAGKFHDAAVTIRQLYSDLAIGGGLKEPTASRFMREWLSNYPNPNRVVALEPQEMQSALRTPNTQNTLADSLMKQRPDLATSGEKTIAVKNLILPEIQTGEANPDIFHTLGQFTMEFTGTIHRGVTTTKSGTTTTPVTFGGTFSFHDTYDWGDSKGKFITIKGFNIPDSYGNLVEKQGLANRFQVGGSISANVTGTTGKASSSKGWR